MGVRWAGGGDTRHGVGVSGRDDGGPAAEAGEGGCNPPLGAAQLLALAVEEYDGADIEELGADQLADDLVAMRRGIDRLEAQFSRRLVRFEATQGYETAGSANLLAWLRTECRMGTSAAARRMHVARQLEELPGTESAWRRGAISSGHAAIIGRTVDDIGGEKARAAESTLLEAAEHMSPGHVWLVGQQIRHRVDPDGALAASSATFARRRLNLTTTIDGALELIGLLDAEGGALIRTAVDALTRPLPGDERVAAQRRADALVELARRQLDGGGLPTNGGQRPHLSLLVSQATLRGEEDSEPAELEWVGPVPLETARRLSCDAVASEVVVDERGNPLSVGRARRTITPAQHRALIVRDRGCRFQGCDRPPTWTDAHHLVHWANDGQTDVNNLVLLCRPHHRLVHEERWTLHWSEAGELVAEPPP